MSANPLSSIPPLGPPSGMPPQSGGSRFKPIDPLRVLRQYALVLILAMIVGVGLGVATWYMLLLWHPVYSSQMAFRLDIPASSPWATSDNMTGQGSSDAIQRAINDQILQLESNDLLHQVINQPQVQNTQWYKNIKQQAGANGDPIQSALDDLQNLLSVSAQQNTSAFIVAVGTQSKSDASVLVSAIGSVYQQRVKDQASQNGSDLRLAFTNAVTNARQQVRTDQQNLQNFTTQENLSTLQSESSDASINYQNLARQQSQLQLQLDRDESQYENLLQLMKSGNLQPTASDQAAVDAMPAIQNLEAQIRQMKQQRETLLERFGENHYSVKQIDRQIATAEQQKKDKIQQLLQQRQSVMVNQAKQQVESDKQQMAKLQPQLKTASDRMTDLTNRLATYHQLQDQLSNDQQQLQKAKNSLDNAQMQQARPDNIPVKLVYPATPPKLTSPRIAFVIPGVTVLVLGLVMGLVFLKELVDQRVKSPADLKMLGETEVLGIIPDAAEDPSGDARAEGIVERRPTGLLAESFRQTRTAVLRKMDRRGYKTLVIAGAQPVSGTSLVTANMAASLASNGRRVLVIDANLRRPNQHQLSDSTNERGLVEVLEGDADVDEVLVHSATLSLATLPTGDSSQAAPEILERPEFRQLLTQLEHDFDIILIDAPPALLTSECQLLSKQVDALALVARAGRDKRGMIVRMTEQLDGHRADILGVILNGVRSSAGGYFRKNYQDFYRYQQQLSGNGKTAKAPMRSGAKKSMVRD